MCENIKIGFAASSGGHFEQLMMLDLLMDKYECFVVTEKTKYVPTVAARKMYFMRQINRREFSCIPNLVCNTLISLAIIFKENPDVIICTGVLAMVPLCLLSKLFGKKMIYIESFAKVTSPTKTGKLLYKYADQFYVQWESMKEFYPNAIYLGGIY